VINALIWCNFGKKNGTALFEVAEVKGGCSIKKWKFGSIIIFYISFSQYLTLLFWLFSNYKWYPRLNLTAKADRGGLV
jgi:hypothetical protein